MSSIKEQTAARYVLIELLETGITLADIARKAGIRKTSLKSFYRAESDSDLMPSEISKLERLHAMAGAE